MPRGRFLDFILRRSEDDDQRSLEAAKVKEALNAQRTLEIEKLKLPFGQLEQWSQKKRTLVLIDIQPGFVDAEHPSFFGTVKALVRFAMGHDWPIMVVEFLPHSECGETWSGILQLLATYPHARRMFKSDQDGSTQILSACLKENYPTEAFVAVGVYTDHCVAATVRGLANACPDSQIEVVPEACIPNTAYDLRNFPLAHNISLIASPVGSADLSENASFVEATTATRSARC